MHEECRPSAVHVTMAPVVNMPLLRACNSTGEDAKELVWVVRPPAGLPARNGILHLDPGVAPVDQLVGRQLEDRPLVGKAANEPSNPALGLF